MADWLGWTAFLLALIPILGIAGAVILSAYLSYENRLAREEAARNSPPPPRDFAAELAALNDATARELAAARAELERTRDTVRRGVHG